MRIDINSIKSSIVVKNTASLGLVQIANYLTPVVIIPLVVRALGTEGFGKVLYAQNVIAGQTILINYGFEHSATQGIALNGDNKEKINSVFWTVIWFKSVLILLSFAILAGLYFTGGKVHNDPMLYIYAALMNVDVVLFPTWFFQGMEQMHKMAIANTAIKTLGALLIVLTIRVESYYRLFVLILSISYVVIGVISFAYVIQHYKLSIKTLKETNKDVIKKGVLYFQTTY